MRVFGCGITQCGYDSPTGERLVFVSGKRHSCAANLDWIFARACGVSNGIRPMNGMAMQFIRVTSPFEDMEIWNASSNGFSFVISYESHSGPGLHGRTGFVASWRPIHQNRCAVRVIGSPFENFESAEKAMQRDA